MHLDWSRAESLSDVTSMSVCQVFGIVPSFHLSPGHQFRFPSVAWEEEVGGGARWRSITAADGPLLSACDAPPLPSRCWPVVTGGRGVSTEPDTAQTAGRAAVRPNLFSTEPFARQIRGNECQGRQGGGGEIGSSARAGMKRTRRADFAC